MASLIATINFCLAIMILPPESSSFASGHIHSAITDVTCKTLHRNREAILKCTLKGNITWHRRTSSLATLFAIASVQDNDMWASVSYSGATQPAEWMLVKHQSRCNGIKLRNGRGCKLCIKPWSEGGLYKCESKTQKGYLVKYIYLKKNAPQSPDICKCSAGYKFQYNSKTDELGCHDIDECLNSTHTCGNDRLCENTDGSYHCKLQSRFHCQESYNYTHVTNLKESWSAIIVYPLKDAIITCPPGTQYCGLRKKGSKLVGSCGKSIDDDLSCPSKDYHCISPQSPVCCCQGDRCNTKGLTLPNPF